MKSKSSKKEVTVQKLLDDLAAYDKTSDAVEYGLRLDVADMIVKKMNSTGWTQQELADRVGVKPPVISKIIHAQQNLTIKSICRILCELGIKPRLLEFEDNSNSVVLLDGSEVSLNKAEQHGPKEASCISEEGGPYYLANYITAAGKDRFVVNTPDSIDGTSDPLVRHHGVISTG